MSGIQIMGANALHYLYFKIILNSNSSVFSHVSSTLPFWYNIKVQIWKRLGFLLWVVLPHNVQYFIITYHISGNPGQCILYMGKLYSASFLQLVTNALLMPLAFATSWDLMPSTFECYNTEFKSFWYWSQSDQSID